jgi:hypothetical protein
METPHTIIDFFAKKGPKFHFHLLIDAIETIKDQLPGVSKDHLEDLYLIKERLITIPQCLICTAHRKFISYKKGYYPTCHSKSCINKNAQIKREDAFIAKYGVKNPKQIPEVYERIKLTNLEKYGYENAASSNEIKEKIKETFIRNYGVDNPSKNPDITAKTKETNLKKYGVDNTYQLPKVLQKIKDTYGDNFGWGSEYFMKKSRETCKKNYGVEYYMMTAEAQVRVTAKMNELYGGRGLGSEEIRKKIEDSTEQVYGVRHPMYSEEIKNRLEATCIERYGGTNVMHDRQIMDRAMTNAMKIKEFQLPSGKIIGVQGYEPFAIAWLLENEYDENDLVVENKSIEGAIGRITYQNSKGKTSRYYPDIYIPKENLIIEVKSQYTIKQNINVNVRKREACLNSGINFKYMIITPNKAGIIIDWA